MDNTANSSVSKKIFIIAWILALIFYFIDYVTRSAPSLMLKPLMQQFGTNTNGILTLVGTYYYTYAICALVAGIMLDKIGARFSMFFGAALLGLGRIYLFCQTSLVATSVAFYKARAALLHFLVPFIWLPKVFLKKVWLPLLVSLNVSECSAELRANL